MFYDNLESLLPYALERSSFSDSKFIIVTSLFLPRIYSAIWFAYVVLPLHGFPHITTKGLYNYIFIMRITWRIRANTNLENNSEILELHNCCYLEKCFLVAFRMQYFSPLQEVESFERCLLQRKHCLKK